MLTSKTFKVNKATVYRLMDFVQLSPDEKSSYRSRIDAATESELVNIHTELRRKSNGSPQHKRIVETGVK